MAIDNSHGGNDPHAIIVAQTDLVGNIYIIDALQTNCSITDMAYILAKQPMSNLDEKQYQFFERYKDYKTGIFIADPNDTFATWNASSIANEYKKA